MFEIIVYPHVISLKLRLLYRLSPFAGKVLCTVNYCLMKLMFAGLNRLMKV